MTATVRVATVRFNSAPVQVAAVFSAAATLTAGGTVNSSTGGMQFTVARGFIGVRYSLANPTNYSGGDTVVLTSDELAALPPSLTRTISGTPVACAAPSYPAYPFHHFAERS